MLLFSAGFFLSILGSLPPGLISLTVSHAAISRGRRAAFAVAFGAAFVEFFQAVFAVSMADWFLTYPQATRFFQLAAAPVFLLLAMYMLFVAKPMQTEPKLPPISGRRQFVKGALVSFFNLLAIPYWFLYCAWLKVEGWWDGSFFSILNFATGVFAGALVCLLLYAWIARLLLRVFFDFARYANKSIGLIFLGLGLHLIWKLFG